MKVLVYGNSGSGKSTYAHALATRHGLVHLDLDSRAGAAAYNSVHSYVAPLALAAWALASQRPATVALIWIAHIGFDRLVGYGLKYPTAFRDTHLGQLARPRDREASG